MHIWNRLLQSPNLPKQVWEIGDAHSNTFLQIENIHLVAQEESNWLATTHATVSLQRGRRHDGRWTGGRVNGFKKPLINYKIVYTE